MSARQLKDRIIEGDCVEAMRKLPKGCVDLVFADPPYGKGLGEAAFDQCQRHGWLVPGALAILEERADVEPTVNTGYQVLDVRTFGDTRMHFYRYQG